MDPVAASEALTPLSITERQRDFLSGRLHNAEREIIILKQTIVDLTRRLAESLARNAPAEQPSGDADAAAK